MQKSQLHNILEKNSGKYIFWKLCSLFGVLFFPSNFDGVFFFFLGGGTILSGERGCSIWNRRASKVYIN